MISKFLDKLKSILFKSAVSSETPLKKKRNQLSLQNQQKRKQKQNKNENENENS